MAMWTIFIGISKIRYLFEHVECDAMHLRGILFNVRVRTRLLVTGKAQDFETRAGIFAVKYRDNIIKCISLVIYLGTNDH